MTLTYDNYLEHYGVKGMKWGVRKGESKKSASNERYERIKESQDRSFQVTSKSGDILDVEVNKPLKLVNWIASKTDKATDDFINSPTLNLLHNGKNVGDASIQHVSKDELNLVWLGINPKHRGRGYASAAFDSAVEYGKQKGYKKLTLEVPGYSPDARHIYEKRGFKVVREPTQKELQKDYIWGGLTHMSLDLDSIRHSSNYDDEFDEVLLNTFTQMSEEEWNLVFDDMEHSITYDDYLEHYGIKGMKWGVRKDRKKTNQSSDQDVNLEGGEQAKKKLDLKDPRVKKAAVAAAGVTAIVAGAYVLSKGGVSVNSLKSSTVKKGAEKAKDIFEEASDIIYFTKPHRDAGVTKNGMVTTGYGFATTGKTKDFFEIFEKSGLGSEEKEYFNKLPNGAVAATFQDLLGRVDAAGRSIPHSVFIPKDQAIGLDSLEDVIDKFGPRLEEEYAQYLDRRRAQNT